MEAKNTGFKPLSLNPEPFPGDENEQLICVHCGAAYTMAEYRRFAYVERSELCVPCGSDRIREQWYAENIGCDKEAT